MHSLTAPMFGNMRVHLQPRNTEDVLFTGCSPFLAAAPACCSSSLTSAVTDANAPSAAKRAPLPWAPCTEQRPVDRDYCLPAEPPPEPLSAAAAPPEFAEEAEAGEPSLFDADVRPFRPKPGVYARGMHAREMAAQQAARLSGTARCVYHALPSHIPTDGAALFNGCCSL